MNDRIRIAAVCLLIGSAFDAVIAWSLYQRGGPFRAAGIALGCYALASYLTTLVLAIELKRWAWRASYAALMINIAIALLLCALLLASNALSIFGALAFGLVAAVGCAGLWGISRPASRELCEQSLRGAA